MFGRLKGDSDYSRQVNEIFGTEGSFTKTTADVTAVKALGHQTDIMLKASAQIANHNLDGSEEFYLGGARGVRAYPQGEASGDEGWLGTAELRYHTNVPGLILSTYLDGGNVKLAHDGGLAGNRTLKGWGIGISYSKPEDWFARLDYARRIGSDPMMSEDAKSKSRAWFILGKIW